MANIDELIESEYRNVAIYRKMVQSDDPTFVPGLNIPFAIAIDIMAGTRVFARRALADRPEWIDDPIVVTTICDLYGELCELLCDDMAFFLSLGPNPALLSELYWLVASFGSLTEADTIAAFDRLREYGVPYPENFATELAAEAARPLRVPATYAVHAHINRMDI